MVSCLSVLSAHASAYGLILSLCSIPLAHLLHIHMHLKHTTTLFSMSGHCILSLE